MKEHELSRTLRHMEHVRERSYEAESDAEERRLVAEYAAMAESIRPYTSGAQKPEPSTPEEMAGEAAAWRSA